jgi:enamine deaminase RidA (YjgF/YER057c/UK114 family)
MIDGNDTTFRATSTGPSGLVIANPKGLHDPAPMAYSHLAIVPAGGRLVFVAGQTGGRDKGSYRDQVRVALGAIRTAMEAAGGTMADVAKLTVYSVGHDEARHDDLATEVKAVFDPGLAPTCTIVPSTQSGTSADQLVEIEAVGVLPPSEEQAP